MPESKYQQQNQKTNKLLILTIFNHANWSTLHVASRYLQVYATPITFDGQGVLSSAKGFAALFLCGLSFVNTWIREVREGGAGRDGHANTGSKGGGEGAGIESGGSFSGDRNNRNGDGIKQFEVVTVATDGDKARSSSMRYSINDALSASASCLLNSNHGSTTTVELNDGNVISSEDNVAPGASYQQQQSDNIMSSNYLQLSEPSNTLYDEISPSEQKTNSGYKNNVAGKRVESSRLKREKVVYTLLFAFVSTVRASSNIASSRYTYPYNITLIASLTPIIIAIFDRIVLHSPFPPLLWPTIILSSIGGFLIAISQTLNSSSCEHEHEKSRIAPTENLIGCSLQLLSSIFSAIARILMKRTEHVLTPTHIVQTNNISNCLFPFLYTILYNPSSWGAFRYLMVSPKSLAAWCIMSIGTYVFASMLQIKLVRRLGPGFYSSWIAVRVLGSMILSAYVLDEGIHGWLEWIGIGMMLITISIYFVETRKWMERREELEEEVAEEGGELHLKEEVEEVVVRSNGGEKLVPASSNEDKPLLGVKPN